MMDVYENDNEFSGFLQAKNSFLNQLHESTF